LSEIQDKVNQALIDFIESGSDVKYRLEAEQAQAVTRQSLLDRSRQVMGDEAVLFADLGTHNGKNIEYLFKAAHMGACVE
jgi:hypothetical protein